ncbi:MAG: hypothetical protein J2P48_21250 [Alphaproteobacteria bacterium]|nr:hypothetical protein [Alphaproteobacteria bacterium]
MISAETIAELEKRGIDYILGARERSTKEVRDVVLADTKPGVQLTVRRVRDKESPGRRPREWRQAALCGLLQSQGGGARRGRSRGDCR